MAEFRPDANEFWQILRRRFDLVRRIGLAVGGAMLAGGLAMALGRSSDAAGFAAAGAAIVGFFAPRKPPREHQEQRPPA